MGGKKKLSFKQIAKRQKQKGKGKKAKPKSTSGKPVEKKEGEIFLPNPKNEKVVGTLKKMKVITPYIIASKFDLRISVAKDFLEELERQKIVEYVSGSKNLKIYKPAG
ncbi:MAG: 30S ribosomal protein S25e [Thermoproteota archaeon]|nr:30S ribosomal protein S25e [Thermoproteota archaeon]